MDDAENRTEMETAEGGGEPEAPAVEESGADAAEADDSARTGRAARMIRWSIEVVLLATVFYVFVFQVSVVRGDSMDPTLLKGDRLIIDKMSLFFTTPGRFDLVVFRSPEGDRRDYIKRVIALPSEEIELRGDEVLINGEPIEQRFEHVTSYDYLGPTRVPSGCYFVLGDNRPDSSDSRSWSEGVWVRHSDLKGIARLRAYPASRAGTL